LYPYLPGSLASFEFFCHTAFWEQGRDAPTHAEGGGEIQMLAQLFGGQRMISVPSWALDNNTIAFVSYGLINPWTN
jgi:hypothetical protein